MLSHIRNATLAMPSGPSPERFHRSRLASATAIRIAQ
jgi:hypothetical protein